jgi:hypothetical protein
MLYWYFVVGLIFFLLPFYVFSFTDWQTTGKEISIISILLALLWPVVVASLILSGFVFLLLVAGE